MFRFILRLFATICLALAVLLAIIDATRSIAADALVLTPLATSWADTSPASLAATQGLVGALAWNMAVAPILSLPGFAVFLALALLLFLLGGRSRAGHGFADD